MCGLAGVVLRRGGPVDPHTLARMGGAIRHRGPDGYGFFLGQRVGFAHVRLSIIDLVSGDQPLANEDQSVVVTFNGEVFNYVELRAELQAAGHRFRTTSDTEVLVHGYEQWGTGLLERLNGDFAFALFDRGSASVLLARDRFGVRPLFYAEAGDGWYFGSEVKALLASGAVPAAPDPEGLDEVFTFWGALPPRTVFRGVRQLEPGTFALIRDGRLAVQRYYHLDYPEALAEPSDAVGQLDTLLRSGTDIRLRADVPVGGYLSGGLDSSIGCRLAGERSPYRLRTFSVAFRDPRFDESRFQELVARELGSLHVVRPVTGDDIAAVFPEVIWHTETPVVRSAPAPMFLLSKLTREHGITVVLTGEGADELFLGYDLFKEVVVRRFCLRQPGSKVRPRLFDRLYPYLTGTERAGEFWRRFFLTAASPDDPLFSHLPRYHLTRRIREFYTPQVRADLGRFDPLEELRQRLPPRFGGWSATARAAYLEVVTLLSPYLLSSQGDRVAMAHAVEGRFPFLDHRLFQFAAALPERSKLKGLEEKWILRRWARDRLPRSIGSRPKQPYRAPDAAAFLGTAGSQQLELLSDGAVREAGIFDPSAVSGLLRRCRTGRVTGFRENQAFLAVLSTQSWHASFLRRAPDVRPLALDGADVLLADAGTSARSAVSIA